MKRSIFIFLSISIIFFSCDINKGSNGNNGSNSNNDVNTTSGSSAYKYSATAAAYDIFNVPRKYDNEIIDVSIDNLSNRNLYFIITTNGNSTHTTKSSSLYAGSIEPALNNLDISIHPGKEKISKFNKNPFEYEVNKTNNILKRELSKMSAPLKSVLTYNLNDSREFYDDADGIVNATLRFKNTVDGKTLNIWVEDKYWVATASGVKNSIDQNMIDALADKFLNSGKNDIYHWDTSIFGAEWGAHNISNLISADNVGCVNILLFDIDSDENSEGLSTGGVLGFFYAKDNFKKSYYSDSNEMLLFYIDAPYFSYKSNSTNWNISDSYPSNIISTLAHEFQHMINFYQKIVKNVLNVGTDTWINEMCSMVAEDLLADKLAVNGPRGILSSNPASVPNTLDGRLPYFNLYNSESLTTWLSGSAVSDILKSYSTSYAFGAYIARNFGGAALFNKIVSGNSYTDYNSVVAAINSLNDTSYTFLDLLKMWGESVVLSDLVINETGFKYNNGSNWYISSLNGYTYNLGSINMYDYTYGSNSGPYFIDNTAGLYKSFTTDSDSNLYLKVGSNASGTFKRGISLKPNQYLTIIVR